MMNHNESHNDDHAWQADQYLLGEFDSETLAAYEHRLGESQDDREALAEEVLLLGTLSQLDATDFIAPQPAEMVTSGERSRRSAWLVWAVGSVTAASLLLAIALFVNQSNDEPLASNDATKQLEELANLWSQDLPALAAAEARVAPDPELRSPLDDDATPPAPAWMLAALAAESQENEPAEPENL